MTDNETILREWFEQLRLDLIAEYDKLGLRASGNYAEKLHYIVTERRGIMLAPNYAYQMEHGRLPGTRPPRQAIEEWIKAKGIVSNIPTASLAFLIQRKIFEKGIKVPNKHNKGKVISRILTVKRISELTKKLTYVNAATISSEILTILNSTK